MVHWCRQSNAPVYFRVFIVNNKQSSAAKPVRLNVLLPCRPNGLHCFGPQFSTIRQFPNYCRFSRSTVCSTFCVIVPHLGSTDRKSSIIRPTRLITSPHLATYPLLSSHFTEAPVCPLISVSIHIPPVHEFCFLTPMTNNQFIIHTNKATLIY